MNKPDFIFECRKCGHLMYVGKSETLKVMSNDCDECGEEPERNWILVGEGNFEEEHGG